MPSPSIPNLQALSGATRFAHASLPFCSQRCRQLDLGAWASDAYRVPGAEPDPGQEPDQG